jgi:hypothetical protein
MGVLSTIHHRLADFGSLNTCGLLVLPPTAPEEKTKEADDKKTSESSTNRATDDCAIGFATSRSVGRRASSLSKIKVGLRRLIYEGGSYVTA